MAATVSEAFESALASTSTTAASQHQAFESALTEARGRRNIKLFNALMSRHARFGELERVELTFNAIRGLQPPMAANEYTYGILLNACTRCGAHERCGALLSEMRRDGVPVTAVAYTTVIKGFVNALDLQGAWTHFNDLLEDTEQCPNIRTVNTMLRGCLYVGDLKGANRLVKIAARRSLDPDQATRDAVVRAACQAFSSKRLKKALAAHAPDGVGTLSPAARVEICVAHALTGKFKRAAKALKLLEVAMEHEGGKGYGSDAMARKEAKRAPKRKADLPKGDKTAGERVLAGDWTCGTCGVNVFASKQACFRCGAAKSAAGDTGDSGGASGGGSLSSHTAVSTGGKSLKVQERSMLRDSLASVRGFLRSAEREAIARRFTTEAVLRFPPVSTASTAVAALPERVAWETLFATPSRPLQLEFGAGTGDWAVMQAAADNSSNWAAVELRCDRACHIHAKGAMRGLSNLAVFAGDAHVVMQRYLPSRSVAHIHVNFPQPPQWEHSEAHLVNRLFLVEAHRLLQPGGSFTLTSDDERYCASVARRLTAEESLAELWQPAFVSPHYKAHEHGLKGHRSAFDELWAARGFAKRFQCRFMARRPRREALPSASLAADETTSQAAVAGDADEGAAGKRKRKKETSKQRKKRRTRERAVEPV